MTPRTVAHQAALSVGFSRQKCWSGLPFPSSGLFLTQGLNPGLLHCTQTLYRLSHQGSFSVKPRYFSGFLGGSVVKNTPSNAGDSRDTSSIPESGRSPGVGNGNLLQYSCLENALVRGAWQATVHVLPKGVCGSDARCLKAN